MKAGRFPGRMTASAHSKEVPGSCGSSRRGIGRTSGSGADGSSIQGRGSSASTQPERFRQLPAAFAGYTTTRRILPATPRSRARDRGVSMTSQFSADAQNGDRMRLCLRGSGGVWGNLPAERGLRQEVCRSTQCGEVTFGFAWLGGEPPLRR